MQRRSVAFKVDGIGCRVGVDGEIADRTFDVERFVAECEGLLDPFGEGGGDVHHGDGACHGSVHGHFATAGTDATRGIAAVATHDGDGLRGGD